MLGFTLQKTHRRPASAMVIAKECSYVSTMSDDIQETFTDDADGSKPHDHRCHSHRNTWACFSGDAFMAPLFTAVQNRTQSRLSSRENRWKSRPRGCKYIRELHKAMRTSWHCRQGGGILRMEHQAKEVDFEGLHHTLQRSSHPKFLTTCKIDLLWWNAGGNDLLRTLDAGNSFSKWSFYGLLMLIIQHDVCHT